MKFNRRTFVASSLATAAVSGTTQAAGSRTPTFISTRREAVWQDLSASVNVLTQGSPDVRVATDQPAQIIDGFGACFNELGFDALMSLPPKTQVSVLGDLFSPPSSTEHGLGFTRCRMPIGANDFARDWYSCNEVSGDFAMRHFSIQRDESSLIPFIKAAQRLQPDLTLWASPWSPPSWMKTNGHYAQNTSSPGQPPNGLTAAQIVPEGSDGFIQDDTYFRAYALYFKRFLEAYSSHGIKIDMVMPQNEFNSNQSFPSCVWTPKGLARFISHLHEAMSPLGVDIFLGTMERPDTQLFEQVYADPNARRAIKGVGLQWAGRGAAPFLKRDHPDLKIYQTEQECGDGRNDWRYARYTWDLMRDYMRAGVSVYQYWNMALLKDRPSTWGWKQNSLVVVDPDARTVSYTPDYYTLKHVSHFVRPGARRVNAQSWTGHDNALAFVNPDGQQVLVLRNDDTEALPLKVGISGNIAEVIVPANSLNTIAL
ncbi:glycoside hydrolase family 30 beta sandwich domain-containing protein [Asticcacaulis sp. AC402]|uniref:glycoside hydrolase family 30 protein n=1 Tax=Asticcacaulis sp. AC402 TaxID=1282361 RepID=UPI0003C3EB56|nr:glycoside hydrolase family 30 protein [Asticcacaulis sp. AC402]ESQ75155.1 hypothetical protein ABAC402_10830 [Asticcacaulis sp. AC402]